jgi:sugar/nucleoside kinase (ribokinase family)
VNNARDLSFPLLSMSFDDSETSFDLIGVGAPIMDLVAAVPDSFLAKVRGEKGGMVMIDADEMAELVGQLPEPPDMTPGGSAANTIFNAARLGLRTTFIGKLGGDDLGRLYRARFGSSGVNTERFKHSDLPNARSLILTTPDAQRTMRTYLGAHLTLGPNEIKPRDFAGCRHAHIEGYLVFNRALADSVFKAARAAGCKISLDLASFEVVRGSREWLLEQLTAGIDLVFANEDEIRALFPDGTNVDFPSLARRLAHYGCTAAVKLGKDGSIIARGGELHLIAPHSVTDAIDSNGAGDAWAAGFLSGYLRNWPLPACGALASFLGAETVRHRGPIIPDTHWKTVKAQAMVLSGQ